MRNPLFLQQNSKHEIRNKSQGPNIEILNPREGREGWNFEHSNFERVSDVVLRIWYFCSCASFSSET